MRLTKKKAVEISIELWEWLAETGCEFKDEWAGWDKYGGMECGCPLCEYGTQRKPSRICAVCPLYTLLGKGCYSLGYEKWEGAKTLQTRKKYARLFLEQLRTLL